MHSIRVPPLVPALSPPALLCASREGDLGIQERTQPSPRCPRVMERRNQNGKTGQQAPQKGDEKKFDETPIGNAQPLFWQEPAGKGSSRRSCRFVYELQRWAPLDEPSTSKSRLISEVTPARTSTHLAMRLLRYQARCGRRLPPTPSTHRARPRPPDLARARSPHPQLLPRPHPAGAVRSGRTATP